MSASHKNNQERPGDDQDQGEEKNSEQTQRGTPPVKKRKTDTANPASASCAPSNSPSASSVPSDSPSSASSAPSDSPSSASSAPSDSPSSASSAPSDSPSSASSAPSDSTSSASSAPSDSTSSASSVPSDPPSASSAPSDSSASNAPSDSPSPASSAPSDSPSMAGSTTPKAQLLTDFIVHEVPAQGIDNQDIKLLAGNISALGNSISTLEERVSAQILALEERVSARISALEERVSARISALEERVSTRISAIEEDVNKIKSSQEEQELKWKFGTLQFNVVTSSTYSEDLIIVDSREETGEAPDVFKRFRGTVGIAHNRGGKRYILFKANFGKRLLIKHEQNRDPCQLLSDLVEVPQIRNSGFFDFQDGVHGGYLMIHPPPSQSILVETDGMILACATLPITKLNQL